MAPDASAPDASAPDASAPDASTLDAAPVVDGPPQVAVAFPPSVSATDAPTITIRGSAEDGNGIAAIWIDGQLASTDNDFADWQLTVANECLLIADRTRRELTEVDLETGANASLMTTGRRLDTPRGVARRPGTEQVYITDSDNDEVVVLDLVSNIQTVVSGLGVGSGRLFGFPQGIAIDDAGGRALVLDLTYDALIGVDLTSGVRTTISEPGTGTGPDFEVPLAIDFDPIANRAIVVDSSLAAVVAVDLATGARTIIADA